MYGNSFSFYKLYLWINSWKIHLYSSKSGNVYKTKEIYLFPILFVLLVCMPKFSVYLYQFV